MTIAPTKVSGNDRRRPKIAAAYALMISSERDPASSDRVGAMRIPPTPARKPPTAQLIPAMRFGWAPFNSTRASSSTFARIDTPMRVLCNRNRSPAAMRTATTIVMAWW